MGTTFTQGSAPWETGTAPVPQGTPAPEYKQGEAPWEKAAAPISKGAKIVQEMHPDFTVGERLLTKNFANSPQAAVAYLKKNHPDMDIKLSEDGQIIGRKPLEAEYRTLDPNPGWLTDPVGMVKDLPLDIADAGTDLAQGVVSGAASALAGTGAGLATGGAGSIPAAMAAGGATNAGLEALKQKAGQKFGIPQEVSGKQVAIAGAAGAASPLLFGTGASAQTLAAKAAEQGLSDAETQSLVNSQRGAIPRIWDYTKSKVLPNAAEFVSGVPAEATKTYAANPQAIQNLKDNGVSDYVQEVHDNLRSGLAQAKNKIGQELEQSIDEAGRTVDLSKTKAIIDGHIAKLENSELKDNPLVKQHIAELKAARDDLFTEVKPQVSQEPVYSSLIGPDGKPLQVGTKDVVTNARQEMANQASAKKAFELQELLKDEAELSKLGQGPQSRFGQGARAADKAWAEASRKAYNSINDELATATEGMSSQLKGKYQQYAQLQRDLQARFKNPDATFKTLSNVNNKGNQMLRERLEAIGEMTGGQVNPIEDANTLSAYKYFAKPEKVPLSSGGSTSTSRTLSLGTLGALVGHKLGGYYGALQGAAAANLVGSPLGVKHYILSGQAVGRGVGKVLSVAPDLIQPAAPLSTWELMQNQQEGANK